MFDYFTQPDPVFGRISWTMGLVWLAALVVSVLLLTRWQISNPTYRRFWRRWAIGTLVLGGLGMVALILNGVQVQPFNIRLWIYLFSVLTLAYWGWAAYHYFTQLPKQVATARTYNRPVRATSQRNAPQARATVQNGTAPDQPARVPRPEATTTRREARRDRKRRSR